MHAWIAKEFARLHNADLDREADRGRLVSLARSARRREAPRAPSLAQRRHALAHLVRLVLGGRTPHPRGH